MKVFFIGATALTIYLIRCKKPFCMTYDKDGDSFPHLLYLLPAAIILTILCHRPTDPDSETVSYLTFDWVLSFSWWLEALAFVP